MGNARRLKEENSDTLIVAAEPLQGELVQGLRSLADGYIPPIIDLALLDRKIFVSNRDAVLWTKRLLDEEGLFVGVSSGAVASIAVRVANELDEGNVVFVVTGRRLEVPQLRRLHRSRSRSSKASSTRLPSGSPQRAGVVRRIRSWSPPRLGRELRLGLIRLDVIELGSGAGIHVLDLVLVGHVELVVGIVLGIVTDARERLPELPHPLAHRAGGARQAARAEEDQRDHEDDDELEGAGSRQEAQS